MKTYYIYHIPGIKIGCTTNIKRRMKAQNFNNWQILEEHNDLQIASTREIELQKQYGLPVDNLNYSQTLENRNCFSKNHNYGKSGKALSEMQSLGGIKATQKELKCPHCNVVKKQPIIYRWHFDNCKHKKR